MDPLGPSWEPLGPSWALLAPFWCHLGAVLGSLEVIRSRLDALLDLRRPKMPALLVFICFRMVLGPWILEFELYRIGITKVCGAKCYVFGGNRIGALTPEGVRHLWYDGSGATLGAFLGRFGGLLGHLGPSWGHIGAILGPSWAVLRLSGAVLTPSWTSGGPRRQHC